jgi:hypothetical protein
MQQHERSWRDEQRGFRGNREEDEDGGRRSFMSERGDREEWRGRGNGGGRYENQGFGDFGRTEWNREEPSRFGHGGWRGEQGNWQRANQGSQREYGDYGAQSGSRGGMSERGNW